MSSRAEFKGELKRGEQGAEPQASHQTVQFFLFFAPDGCGQQIYVVVSFFNFLCTDDNNTTITPLIFSSAFF